MMEASTHLTSSYNVYLVCLSFIIALFASYTALNLAKRVLSSKGRKQTLWLVGGAFVMGLGIWSMHFIAMLAFHLPQGASYHVATVAVSILVSFLGSLFGFASASRPRFNKYKLLIGGGFMGLAISGMHYIGMSALEGVAISYNPYLFTLSIIIAIIASITALFLSFHTHKSFWMSGLLMGIAITGMHYTGMAAATMTIPDHAMTMLMDNQNMDYVDMAIYVAFGTIVIFGISFISSLTADQRLAEQLALKGSILDSAIDCIMMFNHRGTVIEFNPAAEQLFGYKREEVIGRQMADRLIPPHPGSSARVSRLLAPSNKSMLGKRMEATALHANQCEFPIEMTVTRIKKEKALIFTVYIRDLTERKRVEQVLRESEERYRRLIEFSPESIFVQNDGLITFVNAAVKHTLDLQDGSELIGKPLISLIHDDYHPAMELWQHNVLSGDGTSDSIELKMVKRGGELIDIEATSIRVQFEGQSFVQTIARDITEKKRYEEAIKKLAYYDMLTGLPNRNLFNKLIAEALEHAGQTGLHVAVMFLDIDRFKFINDTMGHPMGDLLLQQFASLLAACTGDNGTVSRLSGDEFVILFPQADRVNAGALARRILASMEDPFRLNQETVYVTTSIGIALYPCDGDNAETLLKNADFAMYAAKKEKNSYRFFEWQMNHVHTRRISIEQSLRQAMEERRFTLHYQPIFHARTRNMAGVEALLRWTDPVLENIPPSEFLPIAEESGQLIAIGEWAIQTACEQMRIWQEAGLGAIPIAVNLSAQQFKQDQLVQTLQRILLQTGLDAKYLAIELKEGIALDGSDRVTAKLNALKALGVSIAIDDFGTGYSSLSHLQTVPVHTIKIDMAFVHDGSKSSLNNAVIEAIIAAARNLDIHVIAKGIETEEQFILLERQGCSHMQGYWFSKPLTAAQFEMTYMQAPLAVELH
ncbi:EAL domain-containing protein [Paenibacillus rhizovicinus]|uniref:EAL domain-containing protein n=1 Tax=Paenibacillus rhizovicinus TaxID=2704463 RepID=A0A6C0P5Z9_9BACL|nr:EAL domain-containing protein [Paenibacillus rhizovicinus]QHW33980.1 EAL domain-containing protein [Paenibacillus rhizovicinus]